MNKYIKIIIFVLTCLCVMAIAMSIVCIGRWHCECALINAFGNDAFKYTIVSEIKTMVSVAIAGSSIVGVSAVCDYSV